MTTTNKNFDVKDRNTYSLAALVSPQATASIAQFIQIQTLCYYYDIAIYCPEYRADVCDLLTELNNAAQAGQLPKRDKGRGRAYINKSGIMVFCDENTRPLPYQALIGKSSSLSISQIKHVNNMLLKNYKQKGLDAAERASRLIPSDVTLESITKTMMVVVKLYKITFSLNRSLEELYEAQNKCSLGIKDGTVKLRNTPGESYIDNQVIRFKAYDPVETDNSDNVENTKTEEGVAQAASSSQQESSNTAAAVQEAVQTITEAVKVTETQPSHLFIYHKAAADKTARIVYIGNETGVTSFSCAYRTSVKTCMSLGIQNIVQNGYKGVTIFIDKKAESFILPVDDFTSENDLCIKEVTNTHALDLQLVDTSSEAYKTFVALCL